MPPSGLPDAPADTQTALARGATVVTATQRLARHLRHAHDTARARAGERAWESPDVLPWDAFVQRSWLQAALRSDERLPAWLPEVEARLLWREVVAEGAGALDAGLLARLAADTWQLCRWWGVTPGELAAQADSAESVAFAGWVRAFLRRCRSLGRIDAGGAADGLSSLPPALLAAVAGPEVRVAGFDPWPPGRDRLLKALGAAGVVTGHAACPGRDRPGAPGQLPCEDEADELRQAAAWARARLEGDPDASIGVVVPGLAERGPEVRRVFLDALVPGWQLQPRPLRPLSVSLGRALADYPVIHPVLVLCRLLAGECDWEDASQLLRSRYLGTAAESRGRARAELKLRTQPFRTIRPDELIALCRGPAPLFAAALDEVVVALRRQPRGRPAEWAGWLAGWLARLGWPGPAVLDSDEYQAVRAWSELLERYAGWESLLGTQPAAAALETLGGLATDTVFEPRGREDGVQVLGVLEATGLAFDHLWIAGVTAEDWPPGPRPHALLPMGLQRKLGLPEATPAGSRALAQRRLAALAGAAGEVVMSWARRRDDEVLLPSPLLAGVAVLPPIATPASDRAGVAGSATPEVLANDPAPPWTGEGTLRGGASLLSWQSENPAVAFVRARLRALELKAPPGPLDASMRGELTHHVLAALHDRPDGRHGLARFEGAVLAEEARTLALRRLAQLLPRRDEALVRLRALETERIVRIVLRLREIEADRAPFTSITEQARELQLGALRLSVRLDRVDETPVGAFVVDYKTGRASTRGWQRDRLADCQLPLYACAGDSAGVAYLRLDVQGVRWSGVGDPGLNIKDVTSPERFLKGRVRSWPELVARWRAQLLELAAEFAAGDFRVDGRAPFGRGGLYRQDALLTRAHELDRFILASDDGEEGP